MNKALRPILSKTTPMFKSEIIRVDPLAFSTPMNTVLTMTQAEEAIRTMK